MHHNFVRWSADELAGGPKQWFCCDNAAEARAILSKHANAAPVAITGHRHIGLNYKELNGVTYFIAPALNSHPMRYSVFNVSNQAIAWKTPMVSVSESNHLEAREKPVPGPLDPDFCFGQLLPVQQIYGGRKDRSPMLDCPAIR